LLLLTNSIALLAYREGQCFIDLNENCLNVRVSTSVKDKHVSELTKFGSCGIPLWTGFNLRWSKVSIEHSWKWGGGRFTIGCCAEKAPWI